MKRTVRILVALCVAEGDGGVFLSGPVFVTEEEIDEGGDVGQPRYYWVRLPRPIPPAVAAGVARLGGQGTGDAQR